MLQAWWVLSLLARLILCCSGIPVMKSKELWGIISLANAVSRVTYWIVSECNTFHSSFDQLWQNIVAVVKFKGSVEINISLFIPVMGDNIQNIIFGEGHMKGKIVTVNKWLSQTTWILLLEAKSVDFLFSFVICVSGFLTRFSLICQFCKAKEKQREYSE